MDEEIRKRNTDCVYFLASPLTCKKGVDCEYRHSEMARFNLRDCWYWLSGNCLNQSCTFRHPPLEAHSETPSESTLLPYQLSVPLQKTNVPCYFYFNGFCNKGEKCLFLHKSDCSTMAGKSLKTAPAVTDALPLENKTSAGSDKVSEPSEAHLSPSETDPKVAMDVKFHHTGAPQHPAPADVQEPSTSPHISVPECEEVALVGSDSVLPAEGVIQSESHPCIDQSSEDQVDDLIEPEERWESSPGFDVLVDDKSNDLGYEDDPEYLPALNMELREPNNHFLGYDFIDPVEYDPIYPDAEQLYERKVYVYYDHLDNEHRFDHVRKTSPCSRDRVLESILSRKRKGLQMEQAVDDWSGVDLRDHLRKRRVIDGCPISRLSRGHVSSHLNGQRYGMGRQLRGRLASQVGKNSIASLGENGTPTNGADQRGWRRHPNLTQSRQRRKEKKRLAKQEFLPSEVRRKSVSKERRSAHESTVFTGPKTLAQIKEEKRKTEENDFGKMGHLSRTTPADFQGPKPLSEILKDKRRVASERDGNSSSN